MQPNLGALTINNIPSFVFNNQRSRYFSCVKPHCGVCSYSSNKYFLKLSRSYDLLIKNNNNCDSKEFVYIINCLSCNACYIGESGRTVSLRIKEHLKSIDMFIPYIKHTPVSSHFNLLNHKKSDFSFLVYKSNLTQYERKFTERKLILIATKLKVKLINLDIYSSLYLNNYNIYI